MNSRRYQKASDAKPQTKQGEFWRLFVYRHALLG